MKGLTARQREIMDWIVSFTRDHSMPPTLREIGRAFGISSPAVLGHLRALERKGYLKRGDMGARSLKIAHMHRREDYGSVKLPTVGDVAAGVPLLAEENLEGTIRVDGRMVAGSGEHFALRVRGDSMIEAGILDGDFAIIRKQETATDGDIVVALVDGDEATLKYFYREKGKFRLQPANSRMKPIYAREVIVQGVLRGVIRTLN